MRENGRVARREPFRVLVPDAADRDIVRRIIYDELLVGRILPSSREGYSRITGSLAGRGAKAILLDTMRIHALAAVNWALSE